MRKRLQLGCILCALHVIVGCALQKAKPADNKPTPIEANVAIDAHAELELYEFLLNDLFSKNAMTNETCYVSLSALSDREQAKIGEDDPYDVFGQHDFVHVDLPSLFFTRFSDRPYRVHPISESPKKRKDSLIETDERYNPKTGRLDGIYSVTIIKWITPTKVRAACEMYRHGLSARGYEDTFERVDGKWRLTGFGSRWVS